MPTLPDVPQTLRCTFQWEISGDTAAIDRLFYTYTGGPPSAADCNTLASGLYTNLIGALGNQFVGDVLLLGVEVVDLTTPTSFSGAHAASTPGTRPGGALGAGTAVLMNLHITRRYRGGKPRTYWPFFADTDLLTEQLWQGGSTATLLADLNTWNTNNKALTAGTTALQNLVNVSYYHGFTAVVNPITGRTRDVPTPRAIALIDVVNSLSVNPNVASQRRRTLIRH